MEPRELRPGFPACPEHLTGEAARLWGDVAAECWKLGTLTEATMPLLDAYCQAHAQHTEISQAISRQGICKTFPSGYIRANPLCKVQTRLIREMLRLSDRLGLTPLSRARIRAARQQSNRDNRASNWPTG